jgi:hypothetical protein
MICVHNSCQNQQLYNSRKKHFSSASIEDTIKIVVHAYKYYLALVTKGKIWKVIRPYNFESVCFHDVPHLLLLVPVVQIIFMTSRVTGRDSLLSQQQSSGERMNGWRKDLA